MKRNAVKLLATLLTLVLSIGIAATSFAANQSVLDVPKSIANIFKIESTDRILYYSEIITDEQSLIQRAKNGVMDVEIVPSFRNNGFEEVQITTQKVMERITEDGIHITSVSATLVGSGSRFSPGDTSELYYTLTANYDMYQHPNWSGIKYLVRYVEGEYTANNSGDNGISSWDLAVTVPQQGYYLYDGSYDSTAHLASYRTAYKTGNNPYPGDTIYLNQSQLYNQILPIPSYGLYAYNTTKVSLGINTAKGSFVSMSFNL